MLLQLVNHFSEVIVAAAKCIWITTMGESRNVICYTWGWQSFIQPAYNASRLLLRVGGSLNSQVTVSSMCLRMTVNRNASEASCMQTWYLWGVFCTWGFNTKLNKRQSGLQFSFPCKYSDCICQRFLPVRDLRLSQRAGRKFKFSGMLKL